MELHNISFLPEYVIKALCNTLLHSLWMGAIMAAITGLVIALTKQARAILRYRLLMATLAAFIVTLGFTFLQQLRDEKINSAVTYSAKPIIKPTLQLPVQVTITDSPSAGSQAVMNSIRQHADLIVLAWLLIVLVRIGQLLIGMQGIRRLRTQQINFKAEWQSKANLLARKLGIEQIVKIAESGLATVPMVIGHLKPLILLPVGLLTALSAAEVEAIIIHELAHIRRRDYLLNLLISVAETLLFFNPAVLWIASLIRAERENCCDDIVINHTGQKTDYIKALIACQEFEPRAKFAMAINGGKGSLTGRVKRMLYGNNQSLNLAEKSSLAVCLVLVIVCTAAFSNKENIAQLAKKATKKVEQVALPFTIFDPVAKVNRPVKVASPAAIDTLPKAAKARPVAKAARLDSLPPLSPEAPLYSGNYNTTYDGSQHKPYNADYKALPSSLGKLNAQLAPINTTLKIMAAADSARAGKPTARTGYSVFEDGSYPVSKAKPVSMKTNDQTSTGDITDELALAMMKSGLADKVLSYKMAENELILNGKKVEEAEFLKFKEKYVGNFKKRTIIYYNYNSNQTITNN